MSGPAVGKAFSPVDDDVGAGYVAGRRRRQEAGRLGDVGDGARTSQWNGRGQTGELDDGQTVRALLGEENGVPTTDPGLMTLTRTRCRPAGEASDFARLVKAALAAAYAGCDGEPSRATMDPMYRRAPALSAKSGMPCFASRNPAPAWTAMTRSQSSIVTSTNGFCGPRTPAQCTIASIRPCAPTSRRGP